MKIKMLAAVAALAGFTAFGASQARAELLVEASVNGGAYSTIYDGASNFYASADYTFLTSGSGSVGGILNLYQNNLPGTATNAQESAGTLALYNSTGSTQTISLLVASTGYLAPTTPPFLLTGSIAVTDGATDTGGSTLTEYACAFTNAGSATLCARGATMTATNSVIDNGSTSANSQSSNQSILASSISTPFEVAEVVTATLMNGANVQLTTAATLAAVPEPASLALLGTSLFGVGMIRRRRRSAV